MAKRFLLQLMQSALSGAVTIPAADWAVRYAYENRGYAAAGGEYFFIPAVFLAVYIGCGWLLDIPEKMRWRKTANIQPIQAGQKKEGVAEKC